MWTDFVSEVTPSHAVSRLNFEKEVLKYIAEQLTLRALLAHLPAGLLVRIWVENDGRLHIRAVKPPKNSVVFEEEEFYSAIFPEGKIHSRNDIDTSFARGEHSAALAFFLTKASQDPLAENNTSYMKLVDCIKMGDMVDGNAIVLDASFGIPDQSMRRLLR